MADEPGSVRVLVADDDHVSNCMLESTLNKWGFDDVIIARDGREAWRKLQGKNAPSLAILDWLMPGMDGVQICRKIRQKKTHDPTYIILLTVKGRCEDIVTGLGAGADDYITKPFDLEELRARMHVGVRIITLQRTLTERVRELEKTLHRVRQLQGLLPICSYCKKIRDDQNYWQQVENYIAEHTAAQISHGVCPECYEKLVEPQMERIRQKRTKPREVGS
jgi:CheY-like chemotaxis protein